MESTRCQESLGSAVVDHPDRNQEDHEVEHANVSVESLHYRHADEGEVRVDHAESKELSVFSAARDNVDNLAQRKGDAPCDNSRDDQETAVLELLDRESSGHGFDDHAWQAEVHDQIGQDLVRVITEDLEVRQHIARSDDYYQLYSKK